MAPIPEPAITPSGSSPKQHQSLAYRLSRRDDDIHRKDVSIAIGIACTTVALAMVAIIIGIVQWNRRRRNTCQKRLPFALERDATLNTIGQDFNLATPRQGRIASRPAAYAAWSARRTRPRSAIPLAVFPSPRSSQESATPKVHSTELRAEGGSLNEPENPFVGSERPPSYPGSALSTQTSRDSSCTLFDEDLGCTDSSILQPTMIKSADGSM
ncbi:hypothetical protein IQ06DRAFT_378428 [Phaeosphaeriaceae sp. SRC1lsM3a]|nr:hypothetical protein IQ06DRAFT_378428 [Stagonospora sp. SRC1lsM3a]